MKRYTGSYGGVETVVGQYPKEEVESHFDVTLPHSKVEGKVLDVFGDDREVIGYMVDNDTIELRVINHTRYTVITH